MNTELLGNAAGGSGLLGFLLMIVVGYAHGGKYRMLFSDPALENKISPTGIKLLIVAGGLLVLALVLEIVSVCG